MKLSVVVPVYNTVEYLQQCIESILSQTYKDMEIILVDDGSTDGSGKVCDEYAKKYSMIQVIHQSNAGNVVARKSGLLVAKGEYVTFMDSDDWLSEDMYEILMDTAFKKECDIVSLGGYIMVRGNQLQNLKDATTFGIYKQGDNLDVFLSKMMFDNECGVRGITPQLAIKVIKRELLVRAMTDINCNIAMGGDASVFYPCCLLAKKICVLDEYKYYYRVREGSVCRTYDIAYFNKIYVLYRYLEGKFKIENGEYNLTEQLGKYIWGILLGQIRHIFGLEIKRTYLFPYKSVDKNSKIILYGAGKVGRSYYEQIEATEYCEVVAWVDQEAHGRDKRLISLQEIVGLEYSQIVIAIKSRASMEEIKSNLIGMGIDEIKIIWKEPVGLPLI